LDTLEFKTELVKPKYSASSVIADVEIFVPLEGLIDVNVERNRLTKEIDRLESQVNSIKSKLLNRDFLNNAPKAIVEREKNKLSCFEINLGKIRDNLKNLEN